MKQFKSEYIGIDQGKDTYLAAYYMADNQESICFSDIDGECIIPANLGLEEALKIAEVNMRQPVKGAVLTVPTMANTLERKVAKELGKKAGLKTVFLLEDSVAALYNYMNQFDLKGKTGIIDIGGRNLKIAVAEITDSTIDLIYADEDAAVGGRTFTDSFMKYVKKKYLENAALTEFDKHKLTVEAERVKKVLNGKKTSCKMFLSSSCGNQSVVVTREEFENCTKRCLKQMKEKFIPLTAMNLKQIILVGGASNMYQYKDFIKQMFPNANVICKKPEETVARGAAVYADLIFNKQVKYKVSYSFKSKKPVSKYSYGIAAQVGIKGSKMTCNLLKKGIELPACIERDVFTKETNQKEVVLEIYKTNTDSNFEEVREENFLKQIAIKIPENLPKMSKVRLKFRLDEKEKLSVERG